MILASAIPEKAQMPPLPLGLAPFSLLIDGLLFGSLRKGGL